MSEQNYPFSDDLATGNDLDQRFRDVETLIAEDNGTQNGQSGESVATWDLWDPADQLTFDIPLASELVLPSDVPVSVPPSMTSVTTSLTSAPLPQMLPHTQPPAESDFLTYDSTTQVGQSDMTTLQDLAQLTTTGSREGLTSDLTMDFSVLTTDPSITLPDVSGGNFAGIFTTLDTFSSPDGQPRVGNESPLQFTFTQPFLTDVETTCSSSDTRTLSVYDSVMSTPITRAIDISSAYMTPRPGPSTGVMTTAIHHTPSSDTDVSTSSPDDVTDHSSLRPARPAFSDSELFKPFSCRKFRGANYQPASDLWATPLTTISTQQLSTVKPDPDQASSGADMDLDLSDDDSTPKSKNNERRKNPTEKRQRAKVRWTVQLKKLHLISNCKTRKKKIAQVIFSRFIFVLVFVKWVRFMQMQVVPTPLTWLVTRNYISSHNRVVRSPTWKQWPNLRYLHLFLGLVYGLGKREVSYLVTIFLITYTAGFRYNAVQCNVILLISLRWLRQNANQSLNPQKTPHTPP